MEGMGTPEQHKIGRSGPVGRPAVVKGKVRKTGLDQQHFRLLAQTKPATKAAQVRQVWPEIKTALAAGHRLKDVQNWLNEVGIEIGYARLSDYVGQLKHRETDLAASTVLPQERRSNRTPEIDLTQGETEYRKNTDSNSGFARSRPLPCPRRNLQTKPSTNQRGIVLWVAVALICAVILFSAGFSAGRVL